MMKDELYAAPVVRQYRRLAILTMGAVVFLILVGGIVRMTGAGMGCPDWPKCFGSWIPPTHVSQLPENYQEIYKDRGYASMEFNATKTWIEYVNRLIGVLIGFITLITAIWSLRLRTILPRVTFLSCLALLMVVIQGGIGAYVVRTNLQTGTITLHMMVALLILLLVISAFLHSWPVSFVQKTPISRSVWVWGSLALLLTLVQVVLGTQVRESVDLIAKQLGEANRATWLEQVTGSYDLHQYFYYAVIGSYVGWGSAMRSLLQEEPIFQRLYMLVIGLLGAEVMLGIGMHNLGMPGWMQPLHLLFATLIVGLCFTLLGILHKYVRSQQATPELTPAL